MTASWAVTVLDTTLAVAGVPGVGVCAPQQSALIDVANTLFTMMSALAAVVAVRLAVREGLASRAARHSEAKRDTYRRVVLDPLLDYLPTFSISVAQVLESRRKDLASLDHQSLVHDQVLRECKKTADEFNERFFQARVPVRQAMIAWDDDKLSVVINERMQQVQDSVIDAIHSLATAQPPAATALTSALCEGTARVMQALVAYNPPQ